VQDALPALLASSDTCSKRWIWEQYDYQVRTNTIAGPERTDAAIIRIKETGESVAMSLDGNGRYCYLSPREGVRLAVAECCRNLSTVGAEPVAATNCLNFGNPERPEIMAQLVEAIEGMSEACRFFDTPITGGNVSLYNETLGEGIYPTPVMGIVGLLKTAAPVTIPFKSPGRAVVLLGGIGGCDETRFGGTGYAKEILKQLWGLPPALDLEREKRVQLAIREIVAAGLAESAHDLSDGGLAVALAECSFGPAGIGAAIDIDSDLRPEMLAFHEAPSRILISTAHPGKVAAIAEKHGIEAPVVGVTIEKGMEIRQRAMTLGSWEIATLRPAYEGALESYVR
jgi:phosphoribosylformylglycinamidine synthase